MTIIDGLGVAGVLLVLSAYLLLQLGRLDAADLRFSLANAAGAALILISLSVDFNLAAALIEGAWLLVSLFGVYRWLRRDSL